LASAVAEAAKAGDAGATSSDDTVARAVAVTDAKKSRREGASWPENASAAAAKAQNKTPTFLIVVEVVE